MSFTNACFLFEIGVKLTVKGLVIPPEDKQKTNRDTFQISFALFSSTSVGEFPLIASSSLCITTREGKASLGLATTLLRSALIQESGCTGLAITRNFNWASGLWVLVAGTQRMKFRPRLVSVREKCFLDSRPDSPQEAHRKLAWRTSPSEETPSCQGLLITCLKRWAHINRRSLIPTYLTPTRPHVPS